MRRALLTVLLWVLATPAAAATYLVAIGNDFGRRDELPLQFAERDAARVVDVLRRLGGVAASDVVLLQGADRAAVEAAIDTVEQRIAREAEAGEDAALVVYYSGHADATGLHLGEETLPYADLRARVAAAPAAARVLILDGCRSGGLTRVKGAKPAEAFSIAMDDRIAVEGLAVMTSSAAGEDSHESDALRGSFFTHHLLAALAGAGDADRDQRVTLNEAYAYAYRHTLRASGRTASLQHPTYAYDMKGRGDFVLTRLDAGRGQGVVLLDDAATWLVRDEAEEGPVRLEVTTDDDGVPLVLPTGRYFLQARHRDHYDEYAVTLEAGQRVDLGRLAARRVAYARLVRKGAAPRAHGLYALGGVEGPTLEGRGPTPVALLGYSLDLPWATFSLRGRFGQSDEVVDGLRSAVRVIGAGLTVERVFDAAPWLSLSVGLRAEGLYLTQDFEASGVTAPDRSSYGLDFGGLFALEVPLFEGFSLRIEGGPMTRVLRVAEVDNGAQVGDAVLSRFTGWGAAGVGVRF